MSEAGLPPLDDDPFRWPEVDSVETFVSRCLRAGAESIWQPTGKVLSSLR